MAGTVTLAFEAKNLGDRKIKVVTAAWTADAANGSVPDTTIAGLSGYLVKAITNPGAVAPTALYDVKLLDSADVTADALAGVLVDRHVANTELVLPTVPPLLSGDYTLNITGNIVNSATGTVILFIDER